MTIAGIYMVVKEKTMAIFDIVVVKFAGQKLKW